MWVIFALLSAFFVATTDPIAKHILKDGDEYFLAWALLLFSTPFLAILYFSNPLVSFSPELVKTILIVVPIEVVSCFLYFKALKLTDISLSVPFLALTPIFVIFTGLLLLGERVSPSGAVGIVMITIGVYSINLKEARHGFVHPIKAIFFNRGSFYMVIVALLFSLTSTLSKKALLCATPESIPFIYNISITIGMTPVILYRRRKGILRIPCERRAIWPYVLLGLLTALSNIFYFQAVALASVAYTIAIKRLSLLMSVGYGWLIFRERDIRVRFLSTLCMVIGVVLIILSR